MKIKLLSFITIIIVSSCATVEREYYTASGKPEVTIESNIETVKPHIIQSAQIQGWSILSDNNYQTHLVRPCGDGAQCIFGQALIGNSYSTPPDYHLIYQWIKLGDSSTKVMVTDVYLSTQMAYGQVNKASLLSGNQNFNDVMNNLMRFKSEIEAK